VTVGAGNASVEAHEMEVLRPISQRTRRVATWLSFVLPIAAWSIVSYVPSVWHPQILITKPGSVNYLEDAFEGDTQSRCRMRSHLLEIWRKIDITIVFITHDLDEAIFLARPSPGAFRPTWKNSGID
jgi:hypothetical protein